MSESLSDKIMDSIPFKMSVALGLTLVVMIPVWYIFFAPIVDDGNKKIQAEHDKLVSMNCKSLGDWLLQDNVTGHDNLIWAQNHYLVACK